MGDFGMLMLLFWAVLLFFSGSLIAIIKTFIDIGKPGKYHDEELIETIDIINGILKEYEVGDYISEKMSDDEILDNDYEYCKIVDIIFGEYAWKKLSKHVKVIKAPQMIVQPLVCKYFNTCTNIADDDERDIVCFIEKDAQFNRPVSNLTIYKLNSTCPPRRRKRDEVIEEKDYRIKKVDADQMQQLFDSAKNEN